MTTDATQVTGSPTLDPDGAQPGDVLAERYELLERIDVDGPSFGYRALDQETERPVLVRMLAGPPLDERTLAEVVERLRGLLGVGGRFLSSLLDADREGRRPFTVEAWPPGTQLSAIIDARRARGEALGPREVLPVTARLVAALAAIPSPWFHGDVRAERVWLDTEGLRLTGAFLLAALPPHLADGCGAIDPGGGASADRWGVAAIAWEALTSGPPDLEATPSTLAPGTLAALRSALDRAPERRARDLSPLLDAIAAQAGLSVPRIDPEAHLPPAAMIGEPPRARPRRVEGAALEGTQEISFDQILDERPLARRIEGAAPEGTQEISFDQILDERPLARVEGAAAEAAPASASDPIDGAANADDTARHAAVPGDDDTLDPRLVRAALGITAVDDPSSSGPIEELPSDELEEVAVLEPERTDARTARPRIEREPPPSERGRATPAPSAPRDGSSEQEHPTSVLPPRERRSAPNPPARTQSERDHPGVVPSPRERPSAPSPPARTQSERGHPAIEAAPAEHRGAPMETVQAPSEHSPAPRARAETPSVVVEQRSTPTPRHAARGEGGGTAVVPRPEEPIPARRSRAGPLIVVVALLVAIAIIGAGFLVRSLIDHERDSARRTRHIQERLQQIRSGDEP